MTSFCAQCGNPLRSGGRFCQSCGTPAQPSAPTQTRDPGGYQSSVPPPSPYGTPAPYAAQSPYAAPPPRSTNWLKIILITMAIIVGLVGVSIVGVVYFVRRTVDNIVSVQETEGGRSEVSINTPGGGVKIAAGSNVTEEQLGVPIYPGAVATKEGGSISISGGEQGRGWLGAATFTTDDGIDEVIDFYREKLGESLQTIDSRQDGKRTVVFNTRTDKGGRIVTVQEEASGTTKISIVGMQGMGATK